MLKPWPSPSSLSLARNPAGFRQLARVTTAHNTLGFSSSTRIHDNVESRQLVLTSGLTHSSCDRVWPSLPFILVAPEQAF